MLARCWLVKKVKKLHVSPFNYFVAMILNFGPNNTNSGSLEKQCKDHFRGSLGTHCYICELSFSTNNYNNNTKLLLQGACCRSCVTKRHNRASANGITTHRLLYQGWRHSCGICSRISCCHCCEVIFPLSPSVVPVHHGSDA